MWSCNSKRAPTHFRSIQIQVSHAASDLISVALTLRYWRARKRALPLRHYLYALLLGAGTGGLFLGEKKALDATDIRAILVDSI